MKTIKSWYCLCGPRKRNFGDKLTKILIEHYTKCKIEMVPRSDREQCELLGVGSILHVFHPYSTGMVWTTGFMREYHRRRLFKADVLAVRGKLTLKKIKLQNNRPVVLGDGGLLCDDFAKPITKKQYKLGIIPHFKDSDNHIIHELAKQSSEIKIIDICDDFQTVIDETQQCDYIISSSLHGVILADSLNIPNDWVELSDKVHGKGFKFKDYYSVFNIQDKKPMKFSSKDNLDTISKKLSSYSRPNIQKIKKSLLKTLKIIGD